jgi:hypothetical protein
MDESRHSIESKQAPDRTASNAFARCDIIAMAGKPRIFVQVVGTNKLKV